MKSQEVNLSEDDKTFLLNIAYDSLGYAVEHGKAMSLDLKNFPDVLLTEKATFVTLKRGGDLRGCIGVTVPVRPLVLDVVNNAYAAGFRDPRFHPLREEELEGLDIDISVLSLPETLRFSSQEELLQIMRPGVDGLILDEGMNRGAFLPVMWEQLRTPEEFLHHLKLKAGLSAHYWSGTIQVSRFTAEHVLHKSF